MPQAVVILLFVAAGLLVLAGVGIRRTRGAPPTRRDTALMAGMTGMALTFLSIVMPVIPLVMFPVAIAGVLVTSWSVDRRWLSLGAFLCGSGLFLAVTQVLRRANDLADPAVTIPGWTPVPLALGVAAAIVGASLLLVAGSDAERP